MNAKGVLVFVALCAGMLAGCNKASEAPISAAGAPTPTVTMQTPPQSPSTATERKDSTSVQGQVDTKEPAQRKDFEKPKP